MSVEVIETGEVIEPMSRVEAERITTRIADKLDGVADSYEQVMPLIREALTRQAHQALGYLSVTEYVSERFKGSLDRLPRELRGPVVRELSAAGMSTRAIAPIVGVSAMQVSRDREQSEAGVTNVTPASDQQVYEQDPPPARSDATSKRPVIGLDGRTYHQPPPLPQRPPQRDPFTITDLESGSPPPPRKRVQDMPQEHWDKVNARQRVESMSAALYTISLLRNEAERARVHEAWVTNPEGAGGFGGPLHTPDMIRALADVMHVYANEMGDRNAR